MEFTSHAEHLEKIAEADQRKSWNQKMERASHKRCEDGATIATGRASSQSTLAQPVIPILGATNDANLLTSRCSAHVEEDDYKRSGLFQAIAKNSTFTSFALFMVYLEAAMLAVDAQIRCSTGSISSPRWISFFANILCLFFSCEIVIRYLAFSDSTILREHYRFCYDAGLVFLRILDTWVIEVMLFVTGNFSGWWLRIIPMVKFLRVFQMGRIFLSSLGVMILIKGMVSSFRSVFLTLVLFVSVLYVFAIMMTMQSHGTEFSEHFASLPVSMMTLTFRGCFMDNIMELILAMEGNFTCLFLFLIFVFLSSSTLLNVLIAVMCEVFSEVKHSEQSKLSLSFVEERLIALFDELGRKYDCITKDDFILLLRSEEAIHILNDVGVDSTGLVDLVDIVFDSTEDGETLTFRNFMNVCWQFRGTKTATVKDLVEMRKFFQGRFDRLEVGLGRIETSVTQLRLPSEQPRGSQASREEPHGLLAGANDVIGRVKPVPQFTEGLLTTTEREWHDLKRAMTCEESFQRSLPFYEIASVVSHAVETYLSEINLTIARELKEVQSRARDRVAGIFVCASRARATDALPVGCVGHGLEALHHHDKSSEQEAWEGRVCVGNSMLNSAATGICRDRSEGAIADARNHYIGNPSISRGASRTSLDSVGRLPASLAETPMTQVLVHVTI
eukprot:TRINITY_DN8503_c0_g1_i8.p1 TRINITY_DN8503_c0_g1~~TRINITY_DN8503_c0_g1_i8.p1  ORF type:complete len:674 (-),score=90.20 TRINITY_DN8503_c0_g1_i8:27-2048(-)